MSTLTDVKSSLAPGAAFDLTNHYITREDHPCFGTRRVTVTKANSSSFYLDDSPWGISWPKASQVQADADGTVRLYGQGASQSATELTMTLVPVRS